MFWFRKRPPQPLLKRRWRWSTRISFLIHSTLVAIVTLEILTIVAVPIAQPPAAEQIVLHAPALAEPPQPPPVELNAFTPNTDQWLADESVDISHLEAAQADSRFTLLTEANLDHDRPEVKEADSFLSRAVMRSIEKSDEVSDQDNLDRLKQLAAQQNTISTQQSIGEINSLVSKVLSVGERASAPAKEPVPGDFDHDTGQLHDMRREMQADGTFKYIAVLLDSAGRTMEAELTAAEGESAYKTFELIKQNPLLERVYRGVVMSLLDKVMKPK